MTASTNGINTFIISTGALAVLCLTIAWYGRNKKRREEQRLRDKILLSPNSSWRKVAKVSKLFCYPFKSGKAQSIEECYFGEYGIVVDGRFQPIEDRMFIAFDEKTRKFITGRSHPKLLTVKFSFVAENRVKFEVDDATPLEFDLPDYKSTPVSLVMWFGEDVNGIDCGSKPSKWFSKYLNGSESGVKLAMRIPNKHRPVTTGAAWKPFAQVYTHMRDEDSGLFSDIASYMILSKESVDDLNSRMEKPIPALQLRPNLVVDGCEPFAEDNWEWIKIGDQAILRSFKLCTRCSMTRVDPDTGIPDPKYEPLKTLRTYRKLKNSVLDELESHAPAIGVYCGLYRTGMVHLNDDIYVYEG